MLSLLLGRAAAQEQAVYGVGTSIAEASPLVMVTPSGTSYAWPASCHMVLSSAGELRLEGADVAPCVEQLETAARLARAAAKVNAKMKRKRGAR